MTEGSIEFHPSQSSLFTPTTHFTGLKSTDVSGETGTSQSYSIWENKEYVLHLTVLKSKGEVRS
jgi:hypothetical protein